MSFDTMPAGPKMDALVAEKVMGYSRASDILVGTYWRKPEHGAYFSFEPSTDIYAAWMVMERLRALGWDVTHRAQNTRVRSVGWHKLCLLREMDCCESEEKTYPLAICRVALQAEAK